MAHGAEDGPMIDCPDWALAFLAMIEDELDRVTWNREQQEYDSPFRNTGNAFACPAFRVAAFDWGWDVETGDTQPANFVWRDIEVRWYKELGRGTTLSRAVSPDEGIAMLDDCLAALRAMDDASRDR